jgi:sugar/nucleoside kinase (ribokinase family)
MYVIEAVVAGHTCLDIIPQFVSDAGADMGAYIAPGRLTEVGAAALSTGGAVLNTGINLHHLGVETRLMGKIGDDLFGRAILDIVRSYSDKLAEGMVIVPDEISSYTFVINPPGVDRAFLHCPGANRTFGVADIRYDLLRESRLFHFGYPPLLRRMYSAGGAELAELFARAQQTGVTTSLDLAMPEPAGPSGQVDWRVILKSVLPYVGLFVPSVEELLFMLDRDKFEILERRVGAAGMLAAVDVATIRALAEQALAWGARVVLLKLGVRGIYLRTANKLGNMGRATLKNQHSWEGRELWAKPFRPRIVASTVGAGDAAIAGFLAAWLRDDSPIEALDMAAAAGASCVEEPGAVHGVYGWDVTRQRIAAGWERLPTASSAPDWTWEPSGIGHGPGDRG